MIISDDSFIHVGIIRGEFSSWLLSHVSLTAEVLSGEKFDVQNVLEEESNLFLADVNDL